MKRFEGQKHISYRLDWYSVLLLLYDFFNHYPELKQPEQETELCMLISAFEKAKTNNLSADDDFEILFERVKKADRKLRWGNFTLQDELFLNLGLAGAGDPERIKRCRKAIKNNSLKNELEINQEK